MCIDAIIAGTLRVSRRATYRETRMYIAWAMLALLWLVIVAFVIWAIWSVAGARGR